MDLREVGCEDVMELSQYHVHWKTLVLLVLNHLFLLPES